MKQTIKLVTPLWQRILATLYPDKKQRIQDIQRSLHSTYCNTHIAVQQMYEQEYVYRYRYTYFINPKHKAFARALKRDQMHQRSKKKEIIL